MPIDLKALARVGAEARLKELLTEVAEIQRAFPGIGAARPGRPRSTKTVEGRTLVKRARRRKMSAAAKKAVSERMRKYWANRRKGKKPEKS